MQTPLTAGPELNERIRRLAADIVADKHPEHAAQLHGGTKLIAAGLLDSMGLVDLILAVEDAFGVPVPEAEQVNLANFDTPNAVAALVARLSDGRIVPAEPTAADPQADVPPMPKGMTVRARKCQDFLAGPRDFDTLILGSSRIMALSAALADRRGYRAYNFAVNNARAEDWYCTFRFALAHNRRKIQRILIGIDIEAFYVQRAIDPRLLSNPHLSVYLDPAERNQTLDELLGEIPAASHERYRAIWRQLKDQTIDSARRLSYDPRTGDLVYLDTDEVSAAFNARRPLTLADGESANPEYRLRMSSFPGLNPKRLGYLVRLVQPCIENGLAVTCFLPPTHAALHEFLCAETVYADRVAEFTGAIQTGATDLFAFHDCSTVDTFGGLPDDFTDPAHIGSYNADALMNFLLDTAG